MRAVLTPRARVQITKSITLERKTVDDVLGGAAAWENVDQTDGEAAPPARAFRQRRQRQPAWAVRTGPALAQPCYPPKTPACGGRNGRRPAPTALARATAGRITKLPSPTAPRRQPLAHTRRLLVLPAALCPACGHRRAYFMQLQIRSADEPMTTFYKVSANSGPSGLSAPTAASARQQRPQRAISGPLALGPSPPPSASTRLSGLFRSAWPAAAGGTIDRGLGSACTPASTPVPVQSACPGASGGAAAPDALSASINLLATLQGPVARCFSGDCGSVAAPRGPGHSAHRRPAGYSHKLTQRTYTHARTHARSCAGSRWRAARATLKHVQATRRRP